LNKLNCISFKYSVHLLLLILWFICLFVFVKMHGSHINLFKWFDFRIFNSFNDFSFIWLICWCHVLLLSTTLLEYAYLAFSFDFATGKVYNSLLLIVVHIISFLKSIILHFVSRIILYSFSVKILTNIKFISNSGTNKQFCNFAFLFVSLNSIDTLSIPLA